MGAIQTNDCSKQSACAESGRAFEWRKSINKRKLRDRSRNRERLPSLATAAFVGAAAGLAGGWAMSKFTGLWNKLSGCPSEPLSYSAQEWDATSKVAKVCVKRTSGRRLTSDELKVAAALVHYAIAGSTGVLYGIAFRTGTLKSRWAGAFFGTGMWLVGNELLLPWLGIVEREDYDRSEQANALGEHLAYGLTTDLICRRLLPNRAETE